jgi:hypothetical protein
MSEDPRKPLDYAAPVKARPVSVLKWLLFAGAVFFSFASLAIQSDPRGSMSGNSAGGAAAGLWIAFALLHINEQKDSRR